jgi:hypothetical protein
MRWIRATIAVALCLFAVACSPAKPPAGRWEGTYETSDTMIAVRLEIAADGSVYLSAPDAMNLGADADPDALRQRLAAELVEKWSEVQPRKFDFDGKTFRKPGGFAPQMEWDSASRRMTVIIYLERRPGIRVPLHAVQDFSANPWPTTS